MIVVALGVAAFVAATTFASSLEHLIDHPRLYGTTWDSVITTWTGNEPPEDDSVSVATAAALKEDPDIEALAFADAGIPFRLYSDRGPERGIPVSGLGVFNLKGSLLAPILEGRTPEGPTEVALGSRMIRELGIRLDPLDPPTVDVALQGNEERTVAFRVVGRAVIPPIGNFGDVGYGVTLTSEAGLVELLAAGDQPPVLVDLLVRWRGDVDPEQALQRVIARYRPRFPNIGPGEDPSVGTFEDAVSFGGVRGMPLIVGGVLAALGAGALAHVLVTAIRRRRRDVAILKTVGFVRGQARRAVGWQATFMVVVATAIGVPIGVVAGRWLWGRIADNIGVISQPRVSMGLILLLLPAVIVIANLIAALPARAAARTRPALVLRSE